MGACNACIQRSYKVILGFISLFLYFFGFYFFIFFQEPVSDEPKTLTLDEWKAQQGKKEGPKFNVRKAGEGSEIDPKWKKATIYKKENEEESEEEEEEEV